MAVKYILLVLTIFTHLKKSTCQILAPAMQQYHHQNTNQPVFTFPKTYTPITPTKCTHCLSNPNNFISVENTKPISTKSPSVVVNNKPKLSQNLDNEVLKNVASALQLLLVKHVMKPTSPNEGYEEADESSALMESSYPFTANSRIFQSIYPTATTLNPLHSLAQMLSPTLSSSTVKCGKNTPIYTQQWPSVTQAYTPVSEQYSQPNTFPPCFTASSILDNYQIQAPAPNANFLGTSNFVDSFSGFNIAGFDATKGSPTPKRSYNLMSPYDAFGCSSEPMLASPYDYGTAKTSDPFSQYLATGDLF